MGSLACSLPPDLIYYHREELDREQAAILENKERGLGLMGEWMDSPKWYGGQVQQIARIVKSSGSYKIHLEGLEKRGRSYRLSRYLGSRRVLQVRVPDDMVLKENQNVKAFLAQKFILCGRVYVPLCSKDNGVYMVETDQDYERFAVEKFGDHLRRSFGDIVRWHNDLALNKDQVRRLMSNGINTDADLVFLANQQMGHPIRPCIFQFRSRSHFRGGKYRFHR